MSHYGWAICPEAVRRQVEHFLCGVREILTDNLTGVYLHGSLALGCFNPERSDIDLLVVTRQGMTSEIKRRIAALLLRCSAAPRPIEVSFLREQDLHPWKYPTPFDFHFGEEWREHYKQNLSGDNGKSWDEEQHKDPDLAAHITVTLYRGLCLYGQPIAEVFPPVPKEHYIASILADFAWAKDRLTQDSVYFVLNACRVCAYLCEGRLCSKDEGGIWARDALPVELREVVVQALEVYRGNRRAEQFAQAELERFAAYMTELLKAAPRFISGRTA